MCSIAWFLHIAFCEMAVVRAATQPLTAPSAGTIVGKENVKHFEQLLDDSWLHSLALTSYKLTLSGLTCFPPEPSARGRWQTTGEAPP